ncbi:MAG: hypothetical protein JXA21_21545 [Anaerolineae bacterium]|nr:hypothetical protein [Anaerolineae bacterium]
MSETTVPQPEKDTPAPPAAPAASAAPATTPSKKFAFLKVIRDAVVQRLRQFQDGFLPRVHYSDGETVLQTIQMSSYRAFVPKILALLSIVLLILAVVLFLVAWFMQLNSDRAVLLAQEISNYELGALLSLITSMYLVFKTVQTWLAYHQWQFIITNTRIIITTPDPAQSFFADSIYLADGTIKVVDTNFSTSPLWLPFQISTGARDVMLSTGGYEFMEKGAKVKGGIRFPDVSSEDVRRLEALVFAKKK